MPDGRPGFGYQNIMITKIRLLLVQYLLLACHGLTVKSPNLEQLVQEVMSQKLNYRVAIGDEEIPFQMKDLLVELSSTLRTSKRSSTGIHEAILLQSPCFVNEEGEQKVSLRDACWEISWRKDSPHGHLTCSLDSPRRVQRTKEGATLEAGRFFLNHRVWTKDTLESERKRRRKIQSEAAKHLDERDQKIQQITNEQGSLGSKVLSYAQAAKSMNDYHMSGYAEALYIPLFDEQVLELAPDLILSTRGEVFQVDRSPERIGLSRVDFHRGEVLAEVISNLDIH